MSGQPMISLVLHLGATGPSVARAQGLLIAKGFPIADELGLFGLSTEEAVRAFQEKQQLRVDGTVSPDVWRALEGRVDAESAAAAAMAASRGQATPSAQPAPVEQPAPVAQPTQAVAVPIPLQAHVVESRVRPSGIGKVLMYGGLGLLAYAAWKSLQPAPPSSFDTYEDDYGLLPAGPDGDDADDSDGSLSGSDSAAGASSQTAIVPFGGGPALKRGAGGKFLPRGGKRLMVDV